MSGRQQVYQREERGRVPGRIHHAEHPRPQVPGCQQKDIDIKVSGINHCHWVMDARDAKTGEDLYPEVRRCVSRLDPDWSALAGVPAPVRLLAGAGRHPRGRIPGLGRDVPQAGLHRLDLPRGGRRPAARRNTSASRRAAGRSTRRRCTTCSSKAGLAETADIVSGLLTNNNAYVLSLNLPNDGFVSNLAGRHRRNPGHHRRGPHIRPADGAAPACDCRGDGAAALHHGPGRRRCSHRQPADRPKR